MSICHNAENVDLFVADAAQISLTEEELAVSYERLQSRLRYFQNTKNTKNSFSPTWGIPALAALFAALFIIPAMRAQNESPLIVPIETVQLANYLQNSGVIIDGNINQTKLLSLLANINEFSGQDAEYTGESLPYLPDIDVFKPQFHDHGIHLLNFFDSQSSAVSHQINTQMIPVEMQLAAETGNGW
jgi:hypothetical protein